MARWDQLYVFSKRQDSDKSCDTSRLIESTSGSQVVVREEDPFPWKQVLIVSIVLFCNVWPAFSTWMVESFKLADETLLGEYSGWLSSSYMLGQTLSCYVWGFVSDRIGRKPVLLIGLAIMTLSNVMFGFSGSFGMALFAHLIGGLGNSIVAVGRTAMSEMCCGKHQAKAFAFIGSSSALGIIFGPAIGGYFTNPAQKMPNTFGRIALFGQYPFALPGIITAIMGFIGWTIAYLYMKESGKIDKQQVFSVRNIREISSGLLSSHQDSRTVKSYVKINSKGSLTNAKSVADESDEGLVASDGSLNLNSSVRAPVLLGSGSQIPVTSIVTQASSCRRRGVLDFARDPYVCRPIISYLLLALYTVMYEEAYILLIRAPESEHGLGFSTDQIGLALSLSGFALFFFQTFFYSYLDKWFGACNTFLIGISIMAPLYVIYPFLNVLNGAPAMMKTIITMGYIAIRTILSYQAFTAILMMVSNSVDRTEKGSLNGLIQSLASVMRFVGPPSIGYIYSVTNAVTSTGSLFDYHFSFYILALFCILTAVYTRICVGNVYDKSKN